MAELTQARLKELLHYDPETGVFTRIKPRQGYRVGTVAGYVCPNGYRQICVDRVLYKAHRLVFLYVHGGFPPYDTDHVNGVKGDNRLSNLRPSTRSQNNQNRGPQSNNTSGFKGVFFHKGAGKWMSSICINKKQMYLGLFDTPEDASRAYSLAALKYHGEFARAR